MMLQCVAIKFVSMAGHPTKCRRFCAEKASDFNKSQQRSTSGLQQVQYQSLKNLKLQQVSISSGIWFGTRWSTPRKSFRFNTENAKSVEHC
jgi:hypothetical protein